MSPENIVIPDATRYGHATLSYAFAAHVAEVSVDAETGRVRIENMTAVHDSGRIINPLTAEGQVEGGVVQGLGWAISEELVFEGGQVLNPNFYDYRIPTVVDAPDIQVRFVDETELEGPYGAKGLGEPALVPTAAGRGQCCRKRPGRPAHPQSAHHTGKSDSDSSRKPSD